MQYIHSRGHRASADVTVVCSEWLAQQQPDGSFGGILLQGVPLPPRKELADRRLLRNELVIGRLCTPTTRKWPKQLLEFYNQLAESYPFVRWEFVGCPEALKSGIERACCGRTVFHTAGWNARSHLWTWDVMMYHHPTLTESFGRVVAESMRAGCVPVVDDRGGFCEQIPPGCGFLSGSPEQFTAAIDRLQCRSQWIAISRRAKAHAEMHFSIEAFSYRLRSTIREAVSAFHRRIAQ